MAVAGPWTFVVVETTCNGWMTPVVSICVVTA